MCVGIALSWSAFPDPLIRRYGLDHRVYDRGGGEKEVHFFYHDTDARLPVRDGGELRIVRWGNRRGLSRNLPRTCWTWQATVESGYWRDAGATEVEIAATLGFERGIWFRIRQGIRGLLITDERGDQVVYMVCEPASHYFEVMTRSDRMPVLIGERI